MYNMDATNITKDEILSLSKHAIHYTNLFIKQCNSWLSEEEGLKNAEKRIREKRAKEKREAGS
jgi:hypothetical protein